MITYSTVFQHVSMQVSLSLFGVRFYRTEKMEKKALSWDFISPRNSLHGEESSM
jgi:hypothetical protein